MNEIEKTFYDAFIAELINPEQKLQCSQEIHEQVVVGIFVADFVINDKYIIEIDGHEWHKTKEQRYDDYRRERYLIRMGYIVIRFTGSEVFVDPRQCAIETLRLINDLTLLQLDEAYETYRKIEERGKSNGKTV
jgi:very-short-patch-repair endonuclease